MKRVRCLCLCAVLALSLALPALAEETETSFPDVDPKTWSWAVDSINYVSEAGYMQGNTDGDFLPGNSVSRAEFIIMVTRVLYPEELEQTANDRYWWDKYYTVAVAHELIDPNDYNNNTDPDFMKEGISRQHMALILMNAVTARGEEIPTKLVTTGQIPDYVTTVGSRFGKAVRQCYTMGLLAGDAEGNFRGNRSMTRAESAIVLHRLVDASVRKPTEVKAANI